MSSQCAVCNAEIRIINKANEADYVECDCCGCRFHPGCTSLSSSEVRLFAFKKTKRQLRFFCPNCEDSGDKLDIKAMLALLNMQMRELKATNELLMKEVETLQKNKQSKEYTVSKPGLDCDSMYAEFIDREKRSRNVMLYNAEEDSNMSSQQRLENDKHTVTSVLSVIESFKCDEVVITRLGNFNRTSSSGNASKHPRPIKVTFPDKATAIRILVNKRKYKGTVRIGPDQTMLQRELMKNLIAECNAAQDKNKRIKYVNGVPGIVTINTNEVTAPGSNSRVSASQVNC